MTIQTRSEKTGLAYHNSMGEALEAAQRDKTIWKISFSVMGEQIRLVKRLKFTDDTIEQYNWVYEHVFPNDMSTQLFKNE